MPSVQSIVGLLLVLNGIHAFQEFYQVNDTEEKFGYSRIEGTVICKSGNWIPENTRLELVDRGYLYNNYLAENQMLSLPCRKLCAFDVQGNNGFLGVRPQLQITHNCDSPKPITMTFDVDKGHVRFTDDIVLK
ncbi:hypothetical protein M3Y95_00419000 [Aphelenchoides besseyi]|nr:hypothetical protein M3Y95_00419000 [Aphelenchoides besseyi]